MNIIEAFDAVKAGKRVQYVLSGRVVALDALGELCWRDGEVRVGTNSNTCRDDAFEVIKPVWKKATLREAFAALVAGKTVSSDLDMLECRYRFTLDGHGLVDGYGDPADVLSDELEHSPQWYILEDD